MSFPGGTMSLQLVLLRLMELAKGMRLTEYALLDLKLVDMPSGCYTWYPVLTEPKTFQVIAKAQAFFSLPP